MFLIGIIWAALAPLLLLVPIGLLSVLSMRTPLSQQAWFVRWRTGVCTALVLVPVAAVWYADRAEFQDICANYTVLKITRHDKAKGFFLDDSTANSFGMRYVEQEGFDWIEAVDYRDRSKFVRYSREGSVITTEVVPAVSAQFEVRSEFTRHNPYVSLNITRVVERASGAELARAGLGQFSGGRLMWLLGAWGTASCPSPGTEDWSNAYHLAKLVLQ